MAQLKLYSITGTIRQIRPSENSCCEQQISLVSTSGAATIIVKPSTLVAGNIRLVPGMTVTVFYDADAPTPLIFPPRYDAVIIARKNAREEIYAGYFDSQLISENNDLQLNINRTTNIVTANGQRFTCSPGNHLLIIFYQTTTRSIPPQTTPRKIIVVC